VKDVAEVLGSTGCQSATGRIRGGEPVVASPAGDGFAHAIRDRGNFGQVDVRAGRYGVGFVSSPIPRFTRSLTSEIRDSDGDEELDAASVSL
jgi:hypothetical protein